MVPAKTSALHSMTGYGRGSASGDRYRISVEIRSVNGRFFDFRAKLPRSILFLEPRLREECNKRIRRGVVDLVVNLHPLEPAAHSVVDVDLAKVFAKEVLALAKDLELPEGLTATSLLRLPGVLSEPEPECLENDGEVTALGLQAVQEAVRGLLEMRKREGERLGKALHRELEELRVHGEWIRRHREQMNKRYFEKLEAKAKEWKSRGHDEVDGTRLQQELLFYLDRSDVTEELDRLESHLNQCDQAIRVGDGGTVGKRLDFLAQELGREVNTIGSKNDHAEVTKRVVEMKLALERLREQAQNLE